MIKGDGRTFRLYIVEYHLYAVYCIFCFITHGILKTCPICSLFYKPMIMYRPMYMCNRKSRLYMCINYSINLREVFYLTNQML